ncbi:AraC family transcriptional regulator [Bacillaceae bacterium JMAK1]|nr:AraC family transcriptional regulator [Bacillaceae bacterium JMAK1]
MDVLKRMNDAIDYIEQNLDQKVNYKEVAVIAQFSDHHFRRMFSFITGVSIAEYVRRRRLTLAAFDLKNHHVRVIDVAMKYGYDSPDAFSRAFQSLHGITPSEVYYSDASLRAFPRMTFQFMIKGAVEMEYRIVEKEAFTVVGKKEKVAMGEGEEFAPMLWEQLETIEEQLKPYDHSSFPGILHISNAKQSNEVTYMIATATEKRTTGEFELFTIPTKTWAVFHAHGPMPEAMLKTWERVYSEWIPMTEYELDDAPEMIRSVGEKIEIWVAIKPEQN